VVHSSTARGPADASPAVPGPIVPEMLIDQHERLRGLLGEVRGSEGAERDSSFARLRRLLAAHETAEEVVVRPVSKQIMKRDEVAARNHEERRIVQLLAVLEKLDTGGSEFAELFHAFAEDLENHMGMEERLEFPALAAELGEPDRIAMARWVERAVAFGPTHAHPSAFGSPMFERAVTPLNALADHARDARERARRHLMDRTSD
jgi:hypothetical protein